MDLGKDPAIGEIVSRIGARDHPIIGVQGTWGSFVPLLVAHVSRHLKRPILFVRAHIDDADKALDDLLTFGVRDVRPLPAWEGEEDLADATD